MIDCGAYGGKGSARELNLPIVKGLFGDTTVDMLRDIGCEGVVVRRGLVDDDQLTGKCCLIVRIDNAVLLAEKGQGSSQGTLSVCRSGGVMHTGGHISPCCAKRPGLSEPRRP